MSRSASIVVATLACSTLLLTGALGHQAPSSPRIAQPLFTAQSSPANAKPVLDEILQRQVDWLSAAVWQKMCDGENSFEAAGTLIRGPGNRLRLEMNIQSAQPARLLIISDGVNLRRSQQIGSAAPTVQCGAATTDVAPSADLVALLKHLRAGLKNPTVQQGLWQDVSVLRISGAWQPRDDTPAELRPALQPRTCHLYLDAKTRWPVRIEWWAAAQPHDAPSLLLQMEFRNLTVNQPLAVQESSRLFSCAPTAN